MSKDKMSIHVAVLPTGERRPVLIGLDGLPDYWTTLFVTICMRNRNRTANTQIQVLQAIRGLFSWAIAHNGWQELVERVRIGTALSNFELEGIRSTLNAALVPSRSKRTRALQVGNTGKEVQPASINVVKSATLHIRMTYVADFLRWLSDGARPLSKEDTDRTPEESIHTSLERLLDSRPQVSGSSLIDARRGLDYAIRNQLLAVIKPGSPLNPFEPLVQHRNEVIIELLLATGARAGEILGLRYEDLDFGQSNDLVIARRHSEQLDSRRHQPVTKTCDRRLALGEILVQKLEEYISTHRGAIPSASKHDFIFVTHAPGPYEGQPLSYKGLAKIFSKLRSTFPDFGDLCAHILRHTTNEDLSIQFDNNKIEASVEEKLRSYQMGWKQGSGTAATYTRRHVERKAKELSLKHQNGIRLPTSLQTDK